jgi:hypothetical protein
MPIYASSNYVPSSAGVPYLLEDNYLKGGYRTVPDTASRDAIHPAARKPGMRVYVQSIGITYTVLTGQLTTWVEVAEGTIRGAYQFTPGSAMSPAGQVDFSVATGKTAIILDVSCTDIDIEIQAHGLAARADVNPYKFVSYAGHLVDDGTTKLLDSTIQFNRRYAILVNQEGMLTQNSYWRVINQGAGTVTPTIDITYLTVET